MEESLGRGVATAVAAVDAGPLGSSYEQVIGVWMAEAVATLPFHDTFVASPYLWPRSHMMRAGVVNATRSSCALGRIMCADEACALRESVLIYRANKNTVAVQESVPIL
jgi:hypothetical protein